MAPDDDEDLGRPIAELRELRIEPSRRFLDRVRGRVQRREAVSGALSASWYVPIAVVLEFLTLLFGLFGQDRTNRGERP